MANIYMTQHDELPVLTATLYDADGPINLSVNSPSVYFYFGRDGELIGGGAATIVSPLLGKVKYTWDSNDTNTPGVFEAIWLISWSGGDQTVPSDAFDLLHIKRKLPVS